MSNSNDFFTFMLFTSVGICLPHWPNEYCSSRMNIVPFELLLIVRDRRCHYTDDLVNLMLTKVGAVGVMLYDGGPYKYTR